MAALQPAANRRAIVWQAGDDRPAVFPLPGENGAPVDVTGWSALATATRSGQVVQVWNTDDGSAVCGPDGVSLLADDSERWAWRNATFDVRVTDLDGARQVVAHGDMTVLALRSGTPLPPTPPIPAGTLVMRHGDSWESPPFALHAGGEPLPLAGWYVRAQARVEGASRPLFAWSSRLTQPGPDVEVSSARWRRRDQTEVTLPTVAVLLGPGDWVGKPDTWEGMFEVELTRGDLDEPEERRTIVPARPLRILPDLIP